MIIVIYYIVTKYIISICISTQVIRPPRFAGPNGAIT